MVCAPERRAPLGRAIPFRRSGAVLLALAALAGCGSSAHRTPTRAALAPLPARAAGDPLLPRVAGHLPIGLSDNAIIDGLASPLQVAQIAAAVGAVFVRIDLYWPAIERSPGVYDWSRYDAQYAALTREGVRPLWILMHTPRWATAPAETAGCDGVFCTGEPTPAALESLQEIGRRLAQRYPLVAGFEYRNEPNLTPHCGPGAPRVAAARYVRGLKAFAAGVHAGRPSTRVLGGALAGCGETPYLKTMLAAGAADAMDGLSFHPYDPTADGSGFPARFAALRAGGAAGLRLLPDEVGTLLSARRLVAEYQQLDGRDPRIPLVRAVDGFGAFTTVEKRDPSLAPYGFLSRKDPDGHFRAKTIFCAFRALAGSRAAPLPRYVVGC